MFHVPCSMNLIILGPQGSGKGTQAKMLAAKLGLHHLEMGDALRDRSKEDSDFGRMLDEIVNRKGTLVSDEIFAQVLTEEIQKVPGSRGIILDGAPRTASQLPLVRKAFADNGRTISGVIHLTLTDSEAVRRIAKRVMCEKCETVYIMGSDVQSLEEPCVKCGSGLHFRDDDNPEAVKRRLGIFHEKTMPVIAEFAGEGLVIEVDGNYGIEQVFADMLAKVEKLS